MGEGGAEGEGVVVEGTLQSRIARQRKLRKCRTRRRTRVMIHRMEIPQKLQRLMPKRKEVEREKERTRMRKGQDPVKMKMRTRKRRTKRKKIVQRPQHEAEDVDAEGAAVEAVEGATEAEAAALGGEAEAPEKLALLEGASGIKARSLWVSFVAPICFLQEFGHLHFSCIIRFFCFPVDGKIIPLARCICVAGHGIEYPTTPPPGPVANIHISPKQF